MSALPARASDELPPSVLVCRPVLALFAAHVVGLGGIASFYDSLRAWAVDGPLFSCTVRVPLLVVAGVLTEFALLTSCARFGCR